MNNKENSPDGIVLLAKQSGLTSFSSLYSVKKALNTKKVGHTGTLDSFAQGLLVVCTGRLTKLAGNITEFDKTYKAVIKFGEETDTLEYTGKIIKKAPLPSAKAFHNSLKKITGTLKQKPPLFSAIHIDGKRASDLARNGENAEIPEREITVFNSELLDEKLNSQGLVEYALVEFSVSKGTYIRSLARDIALDCNSAGHLTGLFRTKVGDFSVKAAAGYSLLEDFSIESAVKASKAFLENKEKEAFNEDLLQAEIREKLLSFSEEVAKACGFISVHLASQAAERDFYNGKPLKNALFIENLFELPCNSIISVFFEKKFIGIINKGPEGRISYRFVIH